MDLQTVKEFLKVDFDDDDNYITFLVDVAKEYIEDCLGSYNDSKKKQGW